MYVVVLGEEDDPGAVNPDGGGALPPNLQVYQHHLSIYIYIYIIQYIALPPHL